MSTGPVTTMKRILPLLLLIGAPPALAEIEYREELAAPNVDVYLELHGMVTDFTNLGGDEQGGLRLRLGLDLNDTRSDHWLWRAELGLNQFGDNASRTSREVDLNVGPPNPDTRIDTRVDRRLSGIELGARLVHHRHVYLRGGLFSYSLRNDVLETRTDLVSNGVTRLPNKDTDAGFGPYLGAGIEIPLVESALAILEYNTYRVEGEQLDNLSAGIRFEF